jgi:hypothetical protein
VTLSRTASGDVLVAVGALLCTGGVWQFITDQRFSEAEETQTANGVPATIYLLPLGVALMLVSSPLAYSALLTLGVALLLVVLADPGCRRRLQSGLSLLRTIPNLASHTVGVLLGALVLLSTAFAWHFGGLAAMADLLPQWTAGFVRWPDSLSLGYPGLILVFYEGLILFLGAIGVALATVRGNSFSLFMALWSILALLLALVRPGHGPGDVLLILVPLACLGGVVLTTVLENLRRWGQWLNEGLYVAVSVPLWAYLVINLAKYNSRAAEFSRLNILGIDASLPTLLSLVVATVLLLLILAAGIGLLQGPGPALRGLGLSTIMALLLLNVATTWGVSQNRPSDPRELLVLEPTSVEVRLLKDSLIRYSNEQRFSGRAFDLTLLTEDPALLWALRDFRDTHIAHITDAPSAASAVIAPKGLGPPPVDGHYVGQSFPVQRRWSAEGLSCRWNTVQLGFDQVRQLDCSALVDWFLFRKSSDRPIEERVVLWLRQELPGQ